MKKIIALLLVATMTFGLVACGGTAETTTAANGQAAVQTVQEGKLIMATNAAFPPYEFMSDEDGSKIVGIDAEIAQVIADELGLELVIEDMEFSSIITAVQSGKVDVALAGLTVTEERKQNINFSEPYSKGVQSVIVKEGSPIDAIEKIATDGSMKVGVQESTTGHIYAASSVEDGGFGEENVVAYVYGALAVQALIADKVDCVIIDNNPAKEFVKANEGLAILDTAYTEEDYAIGISKTNEELLAAINIVLAAKTADGTIQAILDKYIKAE